MKFISYIMDISRWYKIMKSSVCESDSHLTEYFLLSYLCRIPKWQNPRIEAIYAHVWNKRLGNKIKWLLQLNLLTKFVSCIKICSQKILLCFFSLFIQITYRFKSVRSLQNLLIETINMRRPFCLRGYFRAFFAYDSDVVFS